MTALSPPIIDHYVCSRLLKVGHFQWFRWGRGILRTGRVTRDVTIWQNCRMTLPPIYGFGPLHSRIWWVRPHRILSDRSEYPPPPPPPVATPMLKNMSRKSVVICKDAPGPRGYYHISQKRVVLCKDAFRAPTSAKVTVHANISKNINQSVILFLVVHWSNRSNAPHVKFFEHDFFFCSQS